MEKRNLQYSDPELFMAIEAEKKREQDGLEMIASENYVSNAVMEATGSVLTNKYAEGMPGHRHYGGCEYVDIVEELAMERARNLFRAKYVNVQPHSGTQANMAAYRAILKNGDKVLSMNPDKGGHITHGGIENFSGEDYEVTFYGLNSETNLIDFDEVRRLAHEIKPKLIIAGGSSYPRIIEFEKFKEIADEVGAYMMVDMAHIAGLVATEWHPNPVPYADIVTTTTHKTLRGPRGGMILTNNKELYDKINAAVFPGSQSGPLMHVIAAKATAFKEALDPEFIAYQEQVINNAKTLAEELKKGGIEIVTGGTDNHMVIVDVKKSKGIGAAEFEKALGTAAITINGVDENSVRLGTPALTTRGMKEPEMAEIAALILTVAENISDEEKLAEVKEQVLKLCKKFPIY